MKIPVLSRVIAGLRVVGRVQKAFEEGKDVVAAASLIRAKYNDLPDDLKDAWTEVDEFIEAVRDVF